MRSATEMEIWGGGREEQKAAGGGRMREKRERERMVRGEVWPSRRRYYCRRGGGGRAIPASTCTSRATSARKRERGSTCAAPYLNPPWRLWRWARVCFGGARFSGSTAAAAGKCAQQAEPVGKIQCMDGAETASFRTVRPLLRRYSVRAAGPRSGTRTWSVQQLCAAQLTSGLTGAAKKEQRVHGVVLIARPRCSASAGRLHGPVARTVQVSGVASMTVNFSPWASKQLTSVYFLAIIGQGDDPFFFWLSLCLANPLHPAGCGVTRREAEAKRKRGFGWMLIWAK